MTQITELLNAKLERGRFQSLLVAQVLGLFILPLAASPENEPLFFQIAVLLVLVASLYAASARRLGMIVAFVLVGPVGFAWLGPDWLPGQADNVLRLLTIGACLLLATVVVTHSLMQHDRVTQETLTGAINVYLLLVFAFALAHASVELVQNGSYTIGGRPLLEHTHDKYDGRAFPTIVYFSVTTLTTLGYGDIIPSTEAARMVTSIEALVGQLYLAIFIGRLIGIQVGERAADRELERQAAEAAQEALEP